MKPTPLWTVSSMLLLMLTWLKHCRRHAMRGAGGWPDVVAAAAAAVAKAAHGLSTDEETAADVE